MKCKVVVKEIKQMWQLYEGETVRLIVKESEAMETVIEVNVPC
jgi:hypothetical protein